MELCKLLLLFTILAFSLFLSSLSTSHASSASLEEISNPKAVLKFEDERSMVDLRSQRGVILEEDDDESSVWLSRRRMSMEKEEDYSGTGANPRHDPNPPGNSD